MHAAKTDQIHNQVLIAQAADTLLTMDGVVASFVMAKRSDDTVGISARSLGDINVQVIMEMLEWRRTFNECRHSTWYAPLMKPKDRLKAAIDEYLEGGYKE